MARAIVLEPEVLLFDEPLSNLDAKLRRRVREEIRALQQELKLTVVYVTHDQQEALAVSDRIIVMNAGAHRAGRHAARAVRAPSSRFVADFIGDANVLDVTCMERSGEHVSVQVGPMRIDVRHGGIDRRRRGVGGEAPFDQDQRGQPACPMRWPAGSSRAPTSAITWSTGSASPIPPPSSSSSRPVVAAPIAEGRPVAVTFDPDAVILIAND